MEKIILHVEGMACAHCEIAIQSAVRKLSGIKKVKASRRKKEVAVVVEIGGKPVTIGAIAKGSGMIHPNMGTMLCFVTTDCAIDAALLQKTLLALTKKTFNRVTVDGDTSTNDTCLVLANGLAGNAPLAEGTADYDAFVSALHGVLEHEAKAIAADGEGASRLLTATVRGAKDEASAEKLAMSVAGSPLVKTAMFGSDANWGRVLCALGYAGEAFDPQGVTVQFASQAGEITVCEKGAGIPFDEDLAKRLLSEDAVTILSTLSEGDGEATAWGCDLTYDYVKINGDYRS
jgi:glutamate N-acetyltransferase/amino-acid N-acetyltransferase